MIDDLVTAAQREDWARARQLLYQHWIAECPKLYAVRQDSPWDGPVEEAKPLLTALAAALCADSNVKEPSLQALNDQMGNSGRQRAGLICGHVFKNGELTYTCKECATDPTCVMCHECFMKSIHSGHKYKIHASGGSGYCDCGDADAWKRGYACDDHASANNDEPRSLPTPIANRLRQFLTVVLQYCYSAVCCEGEQQSGVPEFLKPFAPEKDKVASVNSFITILYNDETHTFDSVIRVLEQNVGCTHQQAMLIATIVDREGRSLIHLGPKAECDRTKQEIQRRTQKEHSRRTEKQGPLELKVLETELVAHQCHAIALLTWLNEQLDVCPLLGDLVGDVLLSEPALIPSMDESASNAEDDASSSFSYRMDIEESEENRVPKNCLLVQFILQDRKMWKAARQNLHQLLMKTVLMNYEQKLKYAKVYLRCYDKIIDDYIDDDHDVDVSIVSLGVQFLTVPSVARTIIEEDNALVRIFKVLLKNSREYVVKTPVGAPGPCMFDFSKKSFPAVLKRAMQIMRDPVYMLNVIPTESQWNDRFRFNFTEGVRHLMVFMGYMQGMDEVRRQANEHQVWEMEWETAFNIQLRSQDTLTLLTAWANSEETVHHMTMKSVFNELLRRPPSIEGEGGSTHTHIDVNGIQSVVQSFDVLHGIVSIHQPLWRFAAGLFAAPPEFLTFFLTKKYETGIQQDLVEDLERLGPAIYENPLRVLVLCAQMSAQLWRRNGFSLINQVHNYFSPLCRTEMFDKDVLMMQVGAATTKEPKDFLLHVLSRYRLVNWADFNFDGSQKQGTPFGKIEQEETSKIVVSLAEDMLQLIIILISERYRPGVGKCTQEDRVKREVLHLLCMGPHPFSQLTKKMSTDPTVEKVPLHEVVNEVAEFRKPASTAAGQFYLRDSYLSQYNPFFFHYSKSNVSAAEQHQQKIRAKMDRAVIACPPPLPCEFEPFFAPIINLLSCPVLLKICRVVFERFAKRNRFSSDRLLHRCLYLIGMGLQEEERSNGEFKFVAAAQEEDILRILENLVASKEVSTHSDLLWWTIQKFNEVAQRDEAPEPSKEPAAKQDAPVDAKAKRAAVAAKMRAQAMQKMQRMQASFMKTVEKEDPQANATSADASNADGHPMPIGRDEDEDYVIMATDDSFPVCMGVNKSKVDTVLPRQVTCILCQETETLQPSMTRPFVCSAYVQKSLLFAQKNVEGLQQLRCDFVPAGLYAGTDASTCSHTMHYDCYVALADNLLARERQRPRQQMMFNQKMIDPEIGEYQCPLCKRLSNAAMPLTPALQLMGVEGFSSARKEIKEEFDVWVARVKELLEAKPAPVPSKPTKGHSRKRSHSERSLADLIKQGDDLSQMPLDKESALSTSVPSASVMSLLIGATSTSSAQPSKSQTHVPTNEESTPGKDPMEVIHQQSLLEHIHNAAEESRRDRRDAKNFSLQTIGQLLKTMPGVATILKKTQSPSFEKYGKSMRAFGKCLYENQDRMAKEKKEFFENNLCGYYTALATWQSTAHIVRSTAAVLAHERKPLFGALNTRQRDCLLAMTRLCAALSFTIQHVPEHCALSLRALLCPPPPPNFNRATSPKSPLTSPQNMEFPTSPVSNATTPDTASISERLLSSPMVLLSLLTSQGKVDKGRASVNLLHIDMLSLAISLAMSIGWTWQGGRQQLKYNKKEREMIPDGSLDEQHCIRLCLYGHYFQAISSFRDAEMAENEDDPDELGAILSELWKLARPNDHPLVDVSGLKKVILEATLSLLRPIGLFYHSLTLVSPPEALKDPSVDELEPLCRYLGLPHNLTELLQGATVGRLFDMWSVAVTEPYERDFLCKQPIRPNLLIELPQDFSSLIREAALYKCPAVPFDETATTMPTMCLVCGSILCSQSYCCQKSVGKETMGACRFHMRSCSGPMGIFLRIRDCNVVLMTTRIRGCMRPAPYVDEFGESDQGFRRGNPLHLNEALYKKLKNLWLTQGIAEEVVNQYEIDHRNLQYDWTNI